MTHLCCLCSDNDVDSKPKYNNPSKHGPISNRSCTDLLCCLIFTFSLIVFLVIGLFAWLNGNPELLVKPVDSDGNLCGHGAYADRPYLLFFDITQCANPTAALNFQCPTTQICVSSCPNAISSGHLNAYTDAVANRPLGTSLLICKDSVDLNTYDTSLFNTPESINFLFEQELCASYTFPSTPVFGRCIPGIEINTTDLNTAMQVVNSAGVSEDILNNQGQSFTGNDLITSLEGLSAYVNAEDFLTAALEDLDVGWPWVIGALAIGAVTSLLWILVMRCFAWPIVWSIILGIFIGLGFGIGWSWKNYSDLKNFGDESSTLKITDVGFTTDLNAYLSLQQTWLAFLIIFIVLEFIFLMVILFLRQRIAMAIGVIKEGSKATSHMVSALFFPLVSYFLIFITTVYYLSTVAFLASSFTPAYKTISVSRRSDHTSVDCIPETFNATNNDPDQICIFLDFGGDSWMHNNQVWVQVITLSLYLWVVNFILALGEMSLAGAFASYYWAWKKPRDIPVLPLTDAFVRSLRYHVGSLAFGSLIITLCQLVRILLEYIDRKTKDSRTKLVKFIICCLRCCLYWKMIKC